MKHEINPTVYAPENNHSNCTSINRARHGKLLITIAVIQIDD